MSVMCMYVHSDTKPNRHNYLYLLWLSGCVHQLECAMLSQFLCWRVTDISEAFTILKEFKHSLQDSLSFSSMNFLCVTQLSVSLWQDPPGSSHSFFFFLILSMANNIESSARIPGSLIFLSFSVCSLLVETEHWDSNHLIFEVHNAEV